jgi:hypothetical protein
MIGLLLSRKFLVTAGSVATVTLTGAGGYLSGFGAHQPPAPQIHIRMPRPTTTIERVTIIKPVRAVIVRGPSPVPGAPGAPGAPGPGGTAAPGPTTTITATATPPPAPARGCDQPPGWCRTSHTPQPASGRP